MAGTWICSKNYAFDRGVPVPGAIAQFFQAATMTPMTVYTDYGLAFPAGSSVVANENGQWPVVYLDETQGFYRYRTNKPDGSILDDITTLAIIGPGMGAGGGGTPVDATQLLSTGDFIWRPTTGAVSGRVRANSQTIGAAGSAASERANADCQALFTFLWTNFSDAECPVTPGGRGANAATDWTNNKAIATPDMRGRGVIGADKMGAPLTAGRITTASTALPDDIGATGGGEKITLTVSQLPAHHHNIDAPATVSTANSVDHTHGVGSFAVGSESAHTHGIGTYVAAAESSHTHGVGTLVVSSDSAGTPAGTIGNESAHTHSIDPPNTTSGNDTPLHTHTLPLSTAHGTGGLGVIQLTGSPDGNVTIVTNNPGVNHTHDVNIAPFTSGAGSSHTHSFTGSALGTHSHTLSGNSAAGSAHTHTLSGTSAAGSAHNHPFTGISAGASATHTHTLDIAPFDSADTGGGQAAVTMPPFMVGTWYIKL